MQLDTWIKNNQINEQLLYKNAAEAMFNNMYTLKNLFWATYYEEDDDGFKKGQEESAQVIGTHSSKSVLLPIVKYSTRDADIIMVVRDNFHDWNMTVISKHPITSDFSLFAEKNTDYCYFQGFPDKYKKESIKKDNKSFSTWCDSFYDLYAFTKIILNERSKRVLPK